MTATVAYNGDVKVCAMPGCDKTRIKARGICENHWVRYRRGTCPEVAEFMGPLRKISDDSEKLARRVQVDDSGCWLWIGARTSAGYGLTSKDGVHVYAHRWSYELHVGPIPAGLDLDHLCRVRACVNPDHLEPVTRKENLRRGAGPGGVLS